MNYLKNSDKVFRILGPEENVRVGDCWIHADYKAVPYFQKTTEQDLAYMKQPLGADPDRVPCIREVGSVNDNIKKAIFKLTKENRNLKLQNDNLIAGNKIYSATIQSHADSLREWEIYHKIMNTKYPEIAVEVEKLWQQNVKERHGKKNPSTK